MFWNWRLIVINILDFFKAGVDQPIINDVDQIKSKYSKYRKEILVTIITLYGWGYTCRLALSVVKKPLIDGGLFSIIDLGLVGSAYFYGYALGKFLNGLEKDSKCCSVRTVLGLKIIVCLFDRAEI